MSEEQHLKDLEDLPNKHLRVGEACLNRHVGYYAESNTCSYRKQGRDRALDDARVYNWPAYRSLAGSQGVRTAAREEDGNVIPEWYRLTLDAPSEGDWDIKGENFKDKCYLPYWHEAHHIVPNSTLRVAIEEVGRGTNNADEITLVIRGGLLDEGYNLNNFVNMIVLPLDREVAMALGLPKHRKTPDHRSHPAYSRHVRTELNQIFQEMRNDAVAHQRIAYSSCRQQLEALSVTLYGQIKAAGAEMKAAGDLADSLDDMTWDGPEPMDL